MRFLLFCIIISFLASPLQAQQEWVDYIVGRPDVLYLEAKKEVVKEWGIAYKIEMAGCIDCENTRLRAQELEVQNQRYFDVLNLRYGNDWFMAFNKAVSKRHNYMLAKEHKETDVWCEYVPEDSDAEYYDIKKEVAKEWGITYQLVIPILAADPLEEDQEKEALRQQFEASYDYEVRLQNRLGEQWKTWIKQETDLRLLQKTAPQEGIWTDIVWGTPNSSYYEAKKEVAKRWGLIYQPRFLGDQRTPALVNQQRDLQRQNAVYFAALNRHFKGTWIAAFHREVQQVYARTQL